MICRYFDSLLNSREFSESERLDIVKVFQPIGRHLIHNFKALILSLALALTAGCSTGWKRTLPEGRLLSVELPTSWKTETSDEMGYLVFGANPEKGGVQFSTIEDPRPPQSPKTYLIEVLRKFEVYDADGKIWTESAPGKNGPVPIIHYEGKFTVLSKASGVRAKSWIADNTNVLALVSFPDGSESDRELAIRLIRSTRLGN